MASEQPQTGELIARSWIPIDWRQRMKADVDSEEAFSERSFTVDSMKFRTGKGLRERGRG